MKKSKRILVLVSLLTLSSTFTSLAGWEQQADSTWKYSDSGSYLTGWQWLDGDGNGTSECYYFDQNGTLLTNTEIEGSSVNAEGQWVSNGIVQTKVAKVHVSFDNINPYANDTLYINMRTSAFKQLETVDFNQEEIELVLSDIVYERGEHSQAVLEYVTREVLSYCRVENSKFGYAQYNNMMASGNVSSNMWIPIITIKSGNPYSNDPYYIQFKDAFLSKMATADLNSEMIELSFPELTFNNNQSQKVMNMQRYILGEIKSTYNILSMRWSIETTDNGLFYLFVIVSMH